MPAKKIIKSKGAKVPPKKAIATKKIATAKKASVKKTSIEVIADRVIGVLKEREPEKVKEIETHWLSSGLAVEKVEKSVKGSKKKSSIGKKMPAIDKDGFVTLNGFFKIHQGTFKILRRNIRKRENTLLLGPTGFGKTELVYNMAQYLDVPLTIFDMGTMTDPIMGLVGTNTIQVKKGKTISKFVKSRFSDVIQKPGIVLLDELSRASLQANNLLFPCLDFRKELNMEYAFDDTKPIKIHPGCIFFATANIGSQYSGTSKIDRALLDRFMLIEMDQLKNTQIIDILSNIYKKLSSDEIKIIVNIYEKINKANENFTISFGLSFRHLKLIASLVQDGFTIYDAYYTLCKGLASKEGLKSIESILSVKGSKTTSSILPEDSYDDDDDYDDEDEDY